MRRGGGEKKRAEPVGTAQTIRELSFRRKKGEDHRLYRFGRNMFRRQETRITILARSNSRVGYEKGERKREKNVRKSSVRKGISILSD